MRKLWIALYGELALEEALDLSYDRLLNELIKKISCRISGFCCSVVEAFVVMGF
jgi:hypothetical protein